MKALCIFCVFLAIFSVFMFNQYKEILKKNIALESEKKALNDDIERYNNAQVRAGDAIQKIREKVKYIKEPCDCWNQPIDDYILSEIRGN